MVLNSLLLVFGKHLENIFGANIVIFCFICDLQSQRFFHIKRKSTEISVLFCCTPAGGRTLDTLIKSQVLYQLSYGSIVCGCKNTTFSLTKDVF